MFVNTMKYIIAAYVLLSTPHQASDIDKDGVGL